MRATKNSIAEMGRNVQDKISSVFHSHNIEHLEEANGPKILATKHINNKASVQDLRSTWLAENAKISLESALDKERVAA